MTAEVSWQDRYTSGDSLSAIADAEGVSASAIAHRAKRAGLTRTRRQAVTRRRLETWLNDGLGVEEMSRRAHVHRRTIQDALIRYRLRDVDRAQADRKRRRAAARAYERGASSYALAERYGVSRRTVMRWVCEEGVTPRRPGRLMRERPRPR